MSEVHLYKETLFARQMPDLQIIKRQIIYGQMSENETILNGQMSE